MKLYKITKGNFCLDKTKEKLPHENNLWFHVEINEKFYEYAIDTINKESINVRCVVVKTKPVSISPDKLYPLRTSESEVTSEKWGSKWGK